MELRIATADDWPRIWPSLRAVVTAGDVYTWPRDIGQDQARQLWMVPAPGRVVVAVDPDGTVLGSAKMLPNLDGPASHVANASFLVDASARGRGVGRALGEYVLDLARADGYRSMQFNAVVETNTSAVALWRALGFEVIGRVPEGFRLPDGAYTGLLIMWRRL